VTDLFGPARLGAVELANRIVMSPLTRCRASPGHMPNRLMAQYYAQRAGAGLIITEGAPPSAMGVGHAGSPGIYTDAQVAAWAEVTAAVHARGGKIFLQILHCGRASHPSLLPAGADPVAPSAIVHQGALTADPDLTPPRPRSLELEEIPGVIGEFSMAAMNAMRAGFDGVELHGANGYLLDQFLRDRSNRRTDRYGGAVANRVRLVLEVIEAVAGVWGADRVGIKISPTTTHHDSGDSDPERTFCHLIEKLGSTGIAYLHITEGSSSAVLSGPARLNAQFFRPLWSGALMVNRGYDLARACAARVQGSADFVSFGRPFISNPDLVRRMQKGLPLAVWDETTFYLGGAHGYTDYPAMEEA
jgi:N-ethylmaleimide reductase